MLFMNEWEVADAEDRYRDDPILGPASQTLRNLVDWTNRNSDGWCYWPKPVRAAAKLQALLYLGQGRGDVTVADYQAALRPVKAFRTRHGGDFVIVQVG